MSFDRERVQRHLQAFEFPPLFNELGWDNVPDAPQVVEIDGSAYTAKPIAQKRGVYAFHCRGTNGLPDHATRRKIESTLAKAYRQHLIVFTDAGDTEQRWLWVRRDPEDRARPRTFEFRRGDSGHALMQRLAFLAFDLDEEDTLTHVDAVNRLAAGLDVEKVTKKFYDEFKRVADDLAKFIAGLPTAGLREEYRLVLLNRLMFLYFIQGRHFLDDNPDYLGDLFKKSKAAGEDRFYRDWLCPLFFDVFAVPIDERDADTVRRFGNVPYLNGGLFQRTTLEAEHEALAVPDAAFERVLDFFADWNWTIDDRASRPGDKEINPDVLGYIFEKYINYTAEEKVNHKKGKRAEMGAYYTKEDVTGYISRNTILPFLLDKVAGDVDPKTFAPGGRVWKLLSDDPARYLYDDVKKGVLDDAGDEIPAPSTDGWTTPRTREQAQGNPHALACETRREYDARRKRCLDLVALLRRGEVTSAADLITHNLHIERFVGDLLDDLLEEDAALLLAFWRRTSVITVLDPTCGSGAFLFAALNLLVPVYGRLLGRMREIVKLNPPSSRVIGPGYVRSFREVVEAADAHASGDYFIHKRIVLNNLFGVDLMSEATEVCKLRLFLKLVAQVKPGGRIEPLPDIDFNIRPGNTLVGYARREDVKNESLFGQEEQRRTEASLTNLDEQFRKFRDAQLSTGRDATKLERLCKAAYRGGLRQVTGDLDRLLAVQYGVDPDDAGPFAKWRESHRPFHWYAEFHGVMGEGGFDCIVGNPPYVEIRNLGRYRVAGFRTESTGDLYSLTVERSCLLCSNNASLGVVIPISAFGLDKFLPLQQEIRRTMGEAWISHFGNRPSQLFEGAQKRVTILIARRGDGVEQFFTSAYRRWLNAEREHLVPTMPSFTKPQRQAVVFKSSIEKVDACGQSILGKVSRVKETIGSYVTSSGTNSVYYTRAFNYFLAFLPRVPQVQHIATGASRVPTELKSLEFASERQSLAGLAVLSSSAFFWFWNTVSDCRNLNVRDLKAMPVDLSDDALSSDLANLAQSYWEQVESTRGEMTKSGLRIETFEIASAKPIIDQIDDRLAKHYGFTEEELDYIKHFDIKYRLGLDAVA